MKKATPYLLLLPAFLFTALVVVYPLVQNVLNSLQDVSMVKGTGCMGRLLQLRTRAARSSLPACLPQYARLRSARHGSGAAHRTRVWHSCSTMKLGRITTVASFLYTIPWVLSPVVAGFAWKWILNDHFGIVNYWLSSMGLVDPAWHGWGTRIRRFSA